MNKSQHLGNKVRAVLLNGHLIANTNYRAELVEVDFAVVNKKIESLNSLALLAQHVNYYVKGITHVFEHGTLEIRDKYSFDFLELDTPLKWDDFVGEFCFEAETLAELIEALPVDELENHFADKKYGTVEHNIEMMIEHSYYHLGQLVLLKKLVNTPE